MTKENIINIIKEKYNIDINNIEKINRGSANIYLLDNKYILKEFQSKYTKEEIDKEINIINHLRKDNIKVPEYIKLLNGEYSFIYNDKVIILQKYIDGYTIEANTGTYNQMIESASYLGKIIKSLENIEVELPTSDISSWYSEETINNAIEKHINLLNKIDKEKELKIYKDLEDKISMLKYVKENIDFTDMKYLTFKNTHGDYSVLQFIYKEDKIEAVLDFVSASKMPIVWEIIRSYSYIDSKCKDGIIDINNLVDYVKEFTKYVKLNKYDLKYMSYLYLIQLLTSTYGYKQYIEDNTKLDLLEFAYFRTNLCKYLFNNRDIISDVLSKEIN